MTHLADAVGELLRQRTLRIHPVPVGRPDVSYTVRAPGLLEQLGDAVGNSTSTGDGAHAVPGPRLPVSADALDLWYQISTSLHAWASDLDVARREPAPVLLSRLRRLDLAQTVAMPVLLRRVMVAAAPHEPIATVMQRRCWCGQSGIAPGDCGRCWAHRIEALLAPQLVDRELRGAACTYCLTPRLDPVTQTIVSEPTTTTVIERDGERFRVPAIVVRVAAAPWAEGADTDLWVYRMCRNCGTEGWLDYSTSTAA